MIPARHPFATVLLSWLGLLAVSQSWLAQRRPEPPELKAAQTLVVTSPGDDGPGSLREAIFSADRARGRALVEIGVARIALRTPLPPLVNPDGVVIDAPRSRCEIDAAAIAGPVLDLAAPRSVLRGLRVRHAADQAVLVRSPGARLLGLDLSDSGEGIYVANGVDDVEVRDSVLEANRTGIHLPPGASRVVIAGNRFARHEQAAVWAVSPAALGGAQPSGLELRDNRFENDRIGAVLIHTTFLAEHNELVGAREAAVYLAGAGVVRRNRILGGAGIGVYADGTDGALVENNEIDRNAAGILLRDARNTTVRLNRLSANAYGIAIVAGESGSPSVVADNLVLAQRIDGLYVVGSSPVLRGNQVLRSESAGLRILDLVPLSGPRRAADPLLRDNVLWGNRPDEPVRGEYRVRPERESR